MQDEVKIALIAAVTTTLLTPLVNFVVDGINRRREHKRKIAPIIEHIRVLREELLQAPLNSKTEGILERIAVIVQFHDPIFICLENRSIKKRFLNVAEHLEARHKQSRPWGQIEYSEECQTFGNAVDRLLAVLNKEKRIPKLFDPSE